jgi:hypothetical protein
MPKNFAPSLFLALSAVACTGVLDDEGDDSTSQCPGAFSAPAATCTGASCTAMLDSVTSKSWLGVVWVSSEINTNDNVNVDYTKSSSALTARIRERAIDRHSPADYALLYAPRIDARIRAESALRSEWPERVDLGAFDGTRIRGRTADLLPKGVKLQQTSCTRSAPDCGAAAVCVLTGGTDGTCESAMTVKLRAGGQNEDIPATVKAVGTNVAIVVDDADTVSDSDVAELLERFDTHIAPIDHQLFGEPVTAEGGDFDGNGVVLVLLTSKVANISSELVGFFYAPDMDPQNAEGNAADLLYMRPPAGAITVDAVSGTLGHEYQHLINFLAKASRGSSPEEVWLDEGLSGFAEDFLGYGGDAFTNIGRYLDAVSETSLTGNGLVATTPDEADGPERRGMAHLFVRRIFERSGGADLGSGAGQVTDKGGIAQVKKLVQTPSTGVDVISSSNTGKSLHDWLGILMTTVALDGTDFKDVSCHPDFRLAEPKTSAFTGLQVGIDLHGTFTNFQGMSMTLNGPAKADLTMESVPVPSNGGEVRTVDVAMGTAMIGAAVAGEDYQVGLQPVPTAK